MSENKICCKNFEIFGNDNKCYEKHSLYLYCKTWDYKKLECLECKEKESYKL